MTNDPERLDADEQAGRLLDEGQPPAESETEMDEAGRRRLAELQLLHGLLVHLHDRDTGARERRVQRVIHALKEPVDVLPHPSVQGGSSGPRGWRRTERIASGLASAAAVLLVCLIGWKLVAPNPAYAVVQRAFEAAALDQDRTYHVVDRDSGPNGGLRESTLWVRGDRFVFEPKQPRIPGLLLGSDGRQGWAVIVTDVGPVRVSDNPLEYYRIMTRGLLPNHRDDEKAASGEMLPLLQQRTLLRNLGQSYRLELLDAEPLAGQGAIRYQHIRARRRQAATGGAEVIELWVHPQSGVIARLRLQAPLESGERLVTLDLVSEAPLPRDWYEHSAHHEAGRPVERWLPGQLPPHDIPANEASGKP